MTTFVDDHGFTREPVDVFISYNKNDAEKIAAISAVLEAEGLRVFWDRKVPAGVNYVDFIGRILDQTKIVLVCWSPSAIQSEWVLSEAEYARTSKRLVACCVEPCSPRPPFNAFRFVDLSGWKGDADDRNWVTLLDLIRHRTRGDASAPTEAVPLAQQKPRGGAKRPATAILLGGLVSGALDITYACVVYGIAYGVQPQRIFQSVAAGVYGREAAVAGGWTTALQGLGLHFFITLGMATVFVIASLVLPILRARAWIAGVIYGLGLYGAMQYVILPLSNAPAGGGPQGWFLVGALFAHTLLVGVPIALIARAMMGPKNANSKAA